MLKLFKLIRLATDDNVCALRLLSEIKKLLKFLEFPMDRVVIEKSHSKNSKLVKFFMPSIHINVEFISLSKSKRVRTTLRKDASTPNEERKSKEIICPSRPNSISDLELLK